MSPWSNPRRSYTDATHLSAAALPALSVFSRGHEPRFVVLVIEKVQWIGIGGSYVWGTHVTGWTVGADVAFRL